MASDPDIERDPAVEARYRAWLRATQAEKDRLIAADPELEAFARERAKRFVSQPGELRFVPDKR